MDQQSTNKLVVLEVSSVTASTGNRRQSDNPEGEGRDEQINLRLRERRNRVKQPLGQEVMRIPPQPPEPRLRRARLRSHLRGSETIASAQAPTPPIPTRRPVPIRQLKSRQLGSQLTPPTPRQLRPGSENSHQRLKPRIVPGAAFPQNSDSKEYRTHESGYTREENKLNSSSQINPWKVNPKSNPPNPFLSRRDENSQPPISRQGVKPKSNDVSRGRKERSLLAANPFQRSKPPIDSGNHHRDKNRARSATAVPGTPAQVETSSARRVKQGTGSQSSGSIKNRTGRRPQKHPSSPFVYVVRLLILGIGIGAIVGTILSALHPAMQASVKTKDAAKTQIQESPTPASRSTPPPLSQEILPLKVQIQTLAAQNPKLQPGVFIVDPDTNAYLDWNSQAAFASASTIKLPILVAFFQDVDKGKIRLDELLTMKQEMIAAGSGDFQYKQPGTQYTALEVATKMITISDNTATNMLITRLGGAEVLNQRFQSWGLTATAIRNRLPDVEGTNTTSPKELASLLSIVNQGELMSMRSRDRLLDIMRKTETNTLLPKGLGDGAIIAHKTGNIGSLSADVGLVDMPTGKRYIVAVMVQRPHNDASAEELIRQISRIVYSYFNQPRVAPNTTSMPLDSTATISRAIAPEIYIN